MVCTPDSQGPDRGSCSINLSILKAPIDNGARATGASTRYQSQFESIVETEVGVLPILGQMASFFASYCTQEDKDLHDCNYTWDTRGFRLPAYGFLSYCLRVVPGLWHGLFSSFNSVVNSIASCMVLALCLYTAKYHIGQATDILFNLVYLFWGHIRGTISMLVAEILIVGQPHLGCPLDLKIPTSQSQSLDSTTLGQYLFSQSFSLVFAMAWHELFESSRSLHGIPPWKSHIGFL
ncbi:hypothetical protein Tco_1016609 [Tanacetum coccineum]|uniref:Uncharacterized protein n=1 Tax=Tanacetum coccineum TaxID=301880 RepID=A0ABQ5FPM6_9ASTR